MDIQTKDGILLRNIPDGTPDDVIKARIAKIRGEAPKPTEEPPTDYGRKATLVGRAAVEGVSDIGGLIGDALTSGPLASVAKSFLKSKGVPTADEYVKGALDKVGLPNPEDANERITRDVVKGIAGAAFGGPVKSIGGALATAAAGGASGAASGTVREEGGSGLMQFLAGLAGGLAVPASTAVLKGVGGGALEVASSLGASRGHQGSIKRLAADSASRLSGQDRNFIRAAEQAATEYVPGAKPTTSEALAQRNQMTQDVRAGGTVRLQKDLTGALGAEDVLPSVIKRQNSAMSAITDRLAGGVGREAQDLVQKQAELARNATTAPMREQALKNANVAGVIAPRLEGEIADKVASKISAMQDSGKMATTAAEQNTLANNFNPVPGQPRVAGRLSANSDRVPEFQAGAADANTIAAQRRSEQQFKEMQLASLEQNGHFPLKSDGVTANIDKVLTTPGPRASDVVQKTLGEVRDKIASLTDKSGVIDSRDLYTVRKEIGNTIQKYAKETANWDNRLAAKLEIDVKGYIDKAIESAGGSGWQDYLKTYGSMSKDVDRLKVGQALSDKLRNEKGDLTATNFLNVLGRGEDALLKTRSGQARATSIEDLFGGDSQSIRNIGEQLARREMANKIAGEVKGGGATGLASGEIPKIPHMLNTTATLTNYILGKLGGDANAPVAKYIAEKMAEGKYSDLLTKQKTDPKRQILEALMRASTASAATQ